MKSQSQCSCGHSTATAWNLSGWPSPAAVRTTIPEIRIGSFGLAALASVTASAVNGRARHGVASSSSGTITGRESGR